jgi:predicted ATPase with chaperone activity
MNDKVPDPNDFPHLPAMVRAGDVLAPEAPLRTEDTGVGADTLADLLLKFGAGVPQFSTDGAARELRLALSIVEELAEQLRTDHLIEILGQTGPFSSRCSVTARGREHAARLTEISGYVGPAPVTLDAYTAMLEWQLACAPEVLAQDIDSALRDLVLTEHAVRVAGLAASSGRSLLLFGPPGNGKTHFGQLLHQALRGELWIPHSISVENAAVRVFDPQWHQPIGDSSEFDRHVDQRWVRIQRPFVTGGGELTLDSFEFIFSRSLRYYEAPLHFKANGGTFLIDDFGRQRVDPRDLINRWIVPLEQRLDYLTLQTGKKVQIPFRQMLIFSTNLDPDSIMDPAFLRRMGYRLHLSPPSQAQYTTIFERCAARIGAAVPPGAVARLLERYRTEGREMQGSQPSELIARVADIARFRRQPVDLGEEALDIAWASYFGST